MKVSPCPNCGHDRAWLIRSIGSNKKRFRIECPQCHYKSENKGSPNKAAKAWNKAKGLISNGN